MGCAPSTEKVDRSYLRDSEPIYDACATGNLAALSHYLESGKNNIDINIIMGNGWTPLCIATAYGHVDVVKYMIRRSIQVWPDVHVLSPTERAAVAFHDDKSMVDLNATNISGHTPLAVAISSRHLENRMDLTNLLLVAGADVNIADVEGCTPLHHACLENDKSAIEVLIKAKADVNICTKTAWSPLMIAAYRGHINAVKKLLEADADLEKMDQNSWSALYHAADQNHEEIVRLLVIAGAKLRSVEETGLDEKLRSAPGDSLEQYKVHEKQCFF